MEPHRTDFHGLSIDIQDVLVVVYAIWIVQLELRDCLGLAWIILVTFLKDALLEIFHMNDVDLLCLIILFHKQEELMFLLHLKMIHYFLFDLLGLKVAYLEVVLGGTLVEDEGKEISVMAPFQK